MLDRGPLCGISTNRGCTLYRCVYSRITIRTSLMEAAEGRQCYLGQQWDSIYRSRAARSTSERAMPLGHARCGTIIIMSSHEMWRHTLVILFKCRMCQNWLKWCSDPPPPTTPKLQLDFFDLKSSWSLGVVVGGGGLMPNLMMPDPPPPTTTTPKLQLDFLELKSSWSLGGGGAGGSGTRPPLPPPPKLQLDFLDFLDLKSSWSLGVGVGGVWCRHPPHHHP